MRARWGPQRVLRLDSLDPTTADNIRAILTSRVVATPDEPETSLQRSSDALLAVATTAIEELLDRGDDS